ncbi:uncharacterized protein BDW70DRAFT_145924 [Aspergillus foveolatus]|uniref:uncharacterized protein n=1 Tax=Aspergillus foveolatus TaxID=210207 RepID=UPI003CCDA036
MSRAGAAFCKAYLSWEGEAASSHRSRKVAPSPSTRLLTKATSSWLVHHRLPAPPKKPKSFNPPNSRVAILPSHCCVDW